MHVLCLHDTEVGVGVEYCSFLQVCRHMLSIKVLINSPPYLTAQWGSFLCPQVASQMLQAQDLKNEQ